MKEKMQKQKIDFERPKKIFALIRKNDEESREELRVMAKEAVAKAKESAKKAIDQLYRL